MDIAFINNEATPYRLHVLRRLVKELPEVRVHNVFTHSIADATVPWQLEAEAELRPVFFADCHLAHNTSWSRRSVTLYRKIREYIRGHDIRLIVLVGYFDVTRLLLLRWAKKTGIPVLLHGDSNVFAESKVRGVKAAVKRRVIRWVLSQVSGLMPMGTCGRAYFRLYADHDLPTFLFPYEPDYLPLLQRDEAAVAAFMTKHQLSTERKRLMYCGRLVAHKGVRRLIQAWVSVAKEHAAWDLVIAGDGELRGELQAMVGEGLRERVKWLGFLQPGELVQGYHACKVLVHPSEYEPWGVVINEAVASGMAVLTTEVGGAAVELVKPGVNGWLIPPRDTQALAAALREAMQANVAETMGEASRMMLKQWRQAADPVQGVREAVRYFAK